MSWPVRYSTSTTWSKVADRMDKRLLIGLIAGLIAFVTALGSLLVLADAAGLSLDDRGVGARALFLAIVALIGGLSMPPFAA